MKKLTLITLAAALLLSACGQDGEPSAKADPKWEETRHLYRTQIQYSGENDNAAKYLEIAGRSKQLFPLLEEHCNAFVMDASAKIILLLTPLKQHTETLWQSRLFLQMTR